MKAGTAEQQRDTLNLKLQHLAGNLRSTQSNLEEACLLNTELEERKRSLEKENEQERMRKEDLLARNCWLAEKKVMLNRS